MWKPLTRIVSPGGKRGRLSVLFFHRVFAAQDPMLAGEPDAVWFDNMLGWMQAQFNLLPLEEAVARWQEGTLPPAAAAISFDDGYRDNLEVAAPLLARRGIPATFFIATGFLDGGIMFNDVVIECLRACALDEIVLPEVGPQPLPLRTWAERSHAAVRLLGTLKYLSFEDRAVVAQELPTRCRVDLPRDLMMSSEQVRSLVAMGFDVGAHTHRHPILLKMSDDAARTEIEQGRERLAAIVQKQVNLFAYPNGRWGKDFDDRHRTMAKAAGFAAAFSTDPGTCRFGSDRWALPRFTPWDKDATRFKTRMWMNQISK